MDSVDLTLKKGSVEDFGSFAFIFENPDEYKGRLEGKDFVFFYIKDGKRTLYSVNGINFVIKQALLKGKEKIVPLPRDKKIYKNDSVLSALIVDVEYDGQKKEVTLLGRGGSTPGIPTEFKIGDLEVSMEWGAKVIKLPKL